MNTLAVLALVFAFLAAPAGVAFGVFARVQIARTGERGAGLALAAIVVGSVIMLAGLLRVGVAMARLAALA